MLYIWRLFVRSEGIRKDGTHSFKDACGHVATQIGFSMGPVADVKVVRHEDRLSIRYANRANGLILIARSVVYRGDILVRASSCPMRIWAGIGEFEVIRTKRR
jgi:hypothetical protein